MESLPYYLGFALACIILSIGLRRRTIWMWYLGWVCFYLFASYFGTFFFSALYAAGSLAAECYACIYLVGGLVLWLPAAAWWATHRHLFGTRATPPPQRGTNDTTPKSPSA